MSLGIGIAAILGRDPSAVEWLVALLSLGLGGLAWFFALPQAATAGDLAVLTSHPKIAWSLSRDDGSKGVLMRGIVVGIALVLLVLSSSSGSQ